MVQHGKSVKRELLFPHGVATPRNHNVVLLGKLLHDEAWRKISCIWEVPDGEVERPVTELGFRHGEEPIEPACLHLQFAGEHGTGKERDEAQFHIVAERDAKTVRADRGVEGKRSFKGLAKLGKSRTDGSGELFSAGSRDHALDGPHKQRIFEACPQPRDGIAEGRLAEPDPLCGPADMSLIVQGLKCKKEIKIDSTDIHDLNISYHKYQLHR